MTGRCELNGAAGWPGDRMELKECAGGIPYFLNANVIMAS